MSNRTTRHRFVSRLTTLALTAAAAFGLAVIPAGAAEIPDSWWWNTARFWESASFSNDGVELKPGAWNLLDVTRDCVWVCWNDWNDVPHSLHVAPNTWLTVWEEARQGACVTFWGGDPFVPGGRTPGRAWDSLTNIAAGDSSGNWNGRISYAVITPVSGYHERPETGCPEAVWFG